MPPLPSPAEAPAESPCMHARPTRSCQTTQNKPKYKFINKRLQQQTKMLCFSPACHRGPCSFHDWSCHFCSAPSPLSTFLFHPPSPFRFRGIVLFSLMPKDSFPILMWKGRCSFLQGILTKRNSCSKLQHDYVIHETSRLAMCRNKIESIQHAKDKGPSFAGGG